MTFVKSVMASLTICVFVAGCSEKLKDAPKTGKVTGIVTLDGNPIAGATVEYSPDNDKKTRGPKSTGVTDASGQYELVAPGNIKGAVIGFHKVTVTCPPPASQLSTSDGSTPKTSGEPCQIPVKFSSVESSGLEQEVNEGANELDLSLKS